jgi:prepilin-type N-terminal cleavage/methylation domain-containing protein
MKKIKSDLNKGFTLIELIVSITIIAVMTVLAIINFVDINKKARDSKRMADLEKIRVALELSRQLGTTYPATMGGLIPTYLQSNLSGPKGDVYDYSQLNSGFAYTLDASLEGVGNTTGNYTTSSCGTNFVCNYRVTNP